MTGTVESKINKKLTESVDSLKEYLKNVAYNFENENDRDSIINAINNIKITRITTEDLKKRKRVKNVVPYFDRCLGKKSNGEQCTRRKKEGCELCGTHIKGTPHGKINDIVENIKKVTVYAREIRGIVYYIDDSGNVYNTEDVYENRENPRVIAKYKIEGESNYSILKI